jgi:hypothetical protein
MRKFSTRREADGGRQKRPSKGILYLVSKTTKIILALVLRQSEGLTKVFS